eukprot:2111856-Amphidinium_carterae.1
MDQPPVPAPPLHQLHNVSYRKARNSHQMSRHHLCPLCWRKKQYHHPVIKVAIAQPWKMSR